LNVVNHAYNSPCAENLHLAPQFNYKWSRIISNTGIIVLVLPQQRSRRQQAKKNRIVAGKGYHHKNSNSYFVEMFFSNMIYCTCTLISLENQHLQGKSESQVQIEKKI